MQLLPEETSPRGSVHFSRYDYVPTEKFFANGQEKKKIALIQKGTLPCELLEYFKKLLAVYLCHLFMARWQCDQMDNLLDNHPLGHDICVHDYSEGYACRQQDETQLEYFDIAKVSLHVTILHRHATEATDGETSTEEEPNLIKVHLFVISDDPGRDKDSVNKVQELIHSYLANEVGYNVIKMHEFNDGGSTQYISPHCVGDLSYSLANFGFHIVQNSL